MYSYMAPGSPGGGLPSTKRLQVNQNLSWLDSHGYPHQAQAALNLDSAFTYNYRLPSPDSNSFTYSLLAMSGVSIPWLVNEVLGSALLGPIPGIPLAPGWGTVIPW
jgi:hypothetical protein